MESKGKTTEGQAPKVIGAHEASQFAVDGVAGMLISPVFVKVLFHTLVEPAQDGAPEVRKALAWLVASPAVWAEVAMLILTNLKAGLPSIESMTPGQLGTLRSILSRVPEVPAEENETPIPSAPPAKPKASH